MKIPGIEASPLRNKLKSRNILNPEFSVCKKTAHELLYKIHTPVFRNGYPKSNFEFK
jgi:hypothetical protein